MQGWSIILILIKTDHIVILIDTERVYNKIKYALMVKILKNEEELE